MIAGFYINKSELEKLRIFSETVIVPAKPSQKIQSCYHLSPETYMRRNPAFCSICGNENKIIVIPSIPEQVKKTLIAYKNDFFKAKNVNNCGCFNCPECYFGNCLDCKKCSCKECKSNFCIETEYPDLSDKNSYESVFECKCLYEEALCECKMQVIDSNYVAGYYIKYDLKLCYVSDKKLNGVDTSGNFCIFYKSDRKQIVLDGEFTDFLKRFQMLQTETNLKASFQIRLV